MNLLTKLYTNPRKTLIQEYICNARDANREIGATTPIKIVAPSRFNAAIHVRDYGPGLSPERIKNVFLYYGASTKSKDNTQTGGFGIGAKSAWAYTDSFSIVSYIDGIKRSYVAHKSGGNGNLDLISEVVTDEVNGTEIIIPVKTKDINYFKACICKTVFFWEVHERPTMVGFEDFSYDLNVTKVYDKLYIAEDGIPHFVITDGSYNFSKGLDYYNNKTIAIIDGIPYQLNIFVAAFSKLNASCKKQMYFKLNTGDLRIAPNREELVFDSDNTRFCETLGFDAKAKLDKYVSEKLEDLKESSQKISQAFELWKTFPIEMNFDGYKFYNGKITDILSEDCRRAFEQWSVRDDKVRRYFTLATIDLHSISSYYYSNIKEPAHKRKFRIRRAIESNNLGRIFVVNDLPKKFTDGDTVRNYLTLEARIRYIKDLGLRCLDDIDVSDYVKPGVKVKAIKKAPEEFCFYNFNGSELCSENLSIDIANLVVYEEKGTGRYRTRMHWDFVRLVRYMNAIGVKFGYMSKRSIALTKSNSNIILYDDWINNHIPNEAAIQRTIFREHYSEIERMAVISPYRDAITDKSFVELLDKIKKPAIVGAAELPPLLLDKVENTTEFKAARERANLLLEEVARVVKKYPLLQHLGRNASKIYIEHLVKYINHINKENEID